MKVFRSDGANQELVIENLENLDDTAALIVTREGGQFKIGIQQESSSMTASMAEKADTISEYKSMRERGVSSQHSGLVHRVKMSGITK